MDQLTPPAEATRPTPMSERTLIAALIFACMLALLFGAALLFPNWPDAVAAERVSYLGWALILAVLCIMVMIIAFASPWLGSVRVSGFGAELDVKGDNETP